MMWRRAWISPWSVFLWVFPLVLASCAGVPIIHSALQKGDMRRTRLALRDKQSVKTIHDGRMPLHLAAQRGDLEAVRLLLAAGAPVDAPFRVGAGGPVAGTALIMAISRGDARMAEVLLQAGAKVGAPGWNGLTPLMEAARMGREGLLRLLLRRGALVNRTDEDGRTALAWAALTGRTGATRVLLAAGADPSLRAVDGSRPEDYARSANHDRVLKALRAGSKNDNGLKIYRKNRR